MSSKMIELGIDKMSVEEQRILALEILDGLKETPVSPLTEEQRTLFARRRAELKANLKLP